MTKQKRHPGYIVGNHWLETAYDRICAGENEEEVLRDCGWVRAPDEPSAALDAERYRWMRSLGYSWESEAAISDMTPEQFDAAVDAARAEFKSSAAPCAHGSTLNGTCTICGEYGVDLEAKISP